jgi:hypothetical protein
MVIKLFLGPADYFFKSATLEEIWLWQSPHSCMLRGWSFGLYLESVVGHCFHVTIEVISFPSMRYFVGQNINNKLPLAIG